MNKKPKPYTMSTLLNISMYLEFEEHHRDHGDGRNLLKETHHQKEDDLVLGIQDMMMVAVLDITMKKIAKHRAKGNREEIASIADRFIEMFSLYK